MNPLLARHGSHPLQSNTEQLERLACGYIKMAVDLPPSIRDVISRRRHLTMGTRSVQLDT